MSPGPWAYASEPAAPRPTVAKYMKELRRHKPALEKLSPHERDDRVLELQRRMLSEEEIREQLPRIPVASPELVRRQELFLDRYRQTEKDLAHLSYDERAAQLTQVKREAMGREYSEPEPLPPAGEAETR
jgi:hypothetical protein